MKAVVVGLLLIGMATQALAQNATSSTTQPTVTNGQHFYYSFGPQASATIKKLIADGYEIKTGFIDPNGGAYLALQKTTSAFLCHSNPNPVCEKLN